MANTLVKMVLVSSPPPETGGAGGSGGGGAGGLPPKDSRCYDDLRAKVAQLWPRHTIVYVQPDKGGTYFRVADYQENYVWRVVGVCRDGYLEVDYRLLKQPGGIRTD